MNPAGLVPFIGLVLVRLLVRHPLATELGLAPDIAAPEAGIVRLCFRAATNEYMPRPAADTEWATVRASGLQDRTTS
jgi:hypothetical protein